MRLHQRIKVYVISLDRAVARRAHMSQLLAKLGIEAAFITAVDGQHLTPEERRRYARGKARRVYGCDMTDNEVACYLSHLRAYSALIASGEEAALVLEDDISCDARLTYVLNSLNVDVPTEWSVLRLQSTKTSVAEPATKAAYGDPIEGLAGHVICRLSTNVLGGCGYVIRRHAAQNLLARSQRIFMPIDQTLDRYWENGIAPYVVRPLPVWHDGAFPSEIGERGRSLAQPQSWIDLVARRGQRAIDSLNKRLFWLTFSPKRANALALRISVGRLGALAATLLAAIAIGISAHPAAQAGPNLTPGADTLASLPASPPAPTPSNSPPAAGIVEAKADPHRLLCLPRPTKDIEGRALLGEGPTVTSQTWLPDEKSPECRPPAFGPRGKGGRRRRWRRLLGAAGRGDPTAIP